MNYFYITTFRSQDRDQCLMLILSQFQDQLINLRDHKMRTLVSCLIFFPRAFGNLLTLTCVLFPASHRSISKQPSLFYGIALQRGFH